MKTYYSSQEADRLCQDNDDNHVLVSDICQREH